MTLFQWAVFVGLLCAGLGFGLWALAIFTHERPWILPHRHHDHLIPPTPRRAHG